MVIARLEDETALTREECERAAENRIKWVPRNSYCPGFIAVVSGRY